MRDRAVNLRDETIYPSAEGARRLAEIVRRARGERTYREFEALTNVTHALLRRIELCDANFIDGATFMRLASPITPYSTEELAAIATQKELQTIEVPSVEMVDDKVTLDSATLSAEQEYKAALYCAGARAARLVKDCFDGFEVSDEKVCVALELIAVIQGVPPSKKE